MTSFFHFLSGAAQVANVLVGAINPALLPPKYQIPIAAGIAFMHWLSSKTVTPAQ